MQRFHERVDVVHQRNQSDQFGIVFGNLSGRAGKQSHIQQRHSVLAVGVEKFQNTRIGKFRQHGQVGIDQLQHRLQRFIHVLNFFHDRCQDPADKVTELELHVLERGVRDVDRIQRREILRREILRPVSSDKIVLSGSSSEFTVQHEVGREAGEVVIEIEDFDLVAEARIQMHAKIGREIRRFRSEADGRSAIAVNEDHINLLNQAQSGLLQLTINHRSIRELCHQEADLPRELRAIRQPGGREQSQLAVN